MTPLAEPPVKTSLPAPAGFSPEWDERYRASSHLSTWPWSDVVSYTHRHAHPRDGFKRVLELGCGAGANIPFYRQIGCDYHAVDGSPAIVAQLHKTFPDLAARIVCADFTRALPFSGQFDVVLDRAAVTHNSNDAVRRALRLAADVLRPGGKFLGVDWFSSDHEDAQRGQRVDAHTRRDIDSRNFAGVGVVHFSDADHLQDLFAQAGLRIDVLDHTQRQQTSGADLVRLPGRPKIQVTSRFASWLVLATRL